MNRQRGRGRAQRSGQGGAQGAQAGQRRVATQDLHGLKQRRGDLATGHGDAQRPEGQAGLDAHLVDDASTQRLLKGSGRELGQALDGFDGGVQNVRRVVLELRDGLLIHLQRVVGDEKEAEHTGASPRTWMRV